MAEKAAGPLATPEETAAHRADQTEEYGTYVAAGDIYFNGALAYTAGDPVPISNVQRYKYDDQNLVVKIDSKSGQDLIKALHEAAVTQSQPVELPPAVSLNVPITDTK